MAMEGEQTPRELEDRLEDVEAQLERIENMVKAVFFHSGAPLRDPLARYDLSKPDG